MRGASLRSVAREIPPVFGSFFWPQAFALPAPLSAFRSLRAAGPQRGAESRPHRARSRRGGPGNLERRDAKSASQRRTIRVGSIWMEISGGIPVFLSLRPNSGLRPIQRSSPPIGRSWITFRTSLLD